jgi:hypothetical protein
MGGWARWLIVPCTFGTMAFSPPTVVWVALTLMVLTIVAGFAAQSVQLGDMSPRLGWIMLGGLLVAAIVVTAAKFGWFMGQVPYLSFVVLGLAATSGSLTGSFLSSLRSPKNMGHEGTVPGRRTESDAPGPSVIGLLVRANQMTSLSESKQETGPGPTIVPTDGAESVEIHYDGAWLPATLAGWQTRDLALFAHVQFVHDGRDGEEWLAADLVRRPGETPTT